MSQGDLKLRRVPSWPEVKRLLDLRDPQVILIEGPVPVEFRINGQSNALSLRCPVSEQFGPAAIGTPEEIRLTFGPEGSPTQWLEIAVAEPELFPYFVSFAETVVDAIHLHGAEVLGAVRTSMRLFRRLVRDVRLLPQEKIIGLLGELWTLDRLIDSRASEALQSWTGPRGEAHDFRIGDVELEVKTTTRQRRIHRIHGVDQLEPSVDARLYLVSVQLAAGGSSEDAFSLREFLGSIRKRLASYGQVDQFEDVIADRYGLSKGDEQIYAEPFRLRSPTRLIVVDDAVPHLLRRDLEQVTRPEMHRIVELEYALDVDGLGIPDGAQEFLDILPTEEVANG
ncbi:MAG TPA: PD-(D/E)XK motif protein [Solirubrobacterales bacterium]|jgi:hypothetical protein|nr:PD-(D/E)XK motif protein [Solirubrobacterales bacterium]